MKPISDSDETNREIAELRGWEYCHHDKNGVAWGISPIRPQQPNKPLELDPMPNYLEWQYAGKLLEEIHTAKSWHWVEHLVWQQLRRGYKLTAAIRRAWLAWKKEAESNV